MIYDDKCYSCAKFAMAASALSRGWIRTAGHYYSQEARKAKEAVFPKGYDATKMFWLINRTGAYGARSGILPLVREVIVGIFKGGDAATSPAACEYTGTGMSCYTPTSVFRRLARMLSHGATFPFDK